MAVEAYVARGSLDVAFRDDDDQVLQAVVDELHRRLAHPDGYFQWKHVPASLVVPPGSPVIVVRRVGDRRVDADWNRGAARLDLAVENLGSRVLAGPLKLSVGAARGVPPFGPVEVVGLDDVYQALEAPIQSWLATFESPDEGSGEDPILVDISSSLERLTALVRELSDDRDRLKAMVEKAQHDTRLAMMEVRRYEQFFRGLAEIGEAVSHGDPISNEEASRFAHEVGATLGGMTIGGVVGNRADAAVVWAASSAWQELEPFVELINRILQASAL